MAPALELEDIRYRYGRRQAVDGVTLTLHPGDCYGFLGHNGAGKTTVMRLALGLLRPDSGNVRILGHDVQRSPRLARAGAGALIERPGCHGHATARQNLVWLARLQGMPRRLASAEADRALELLGLAPAAHRRAGTFSMGMRQRLGIAMALLDRPRLLLLDEPGNGLDPEGIADLRRLLRQLCGEGTAVMLSSHQLSELDGVCNRIGVLRDGAMVVEGDLDSLRRRIGTRHVVAGEPLPALQQRLEALGLTPVREGSRLAVDLGERAPGAIVRELAAVGDVTTFAPEAATLEAIYLSASNGGAQLPRAEPLRPEPPRAPVVEASPVPEPSWRAAGKPFARAFGHELRTLRSRRTTLPLLLAPAAIAAWSVVAYDRKIAASLARVADGQVFSTDAGSGFLATAHAMQAAVPVVALAALWFGSQSVATDLAADTLRNTLQRSVDRIDTLLGKLAVLVAATSASFVTAVVTAMPLAALLLGFHDLEEVSRHGDRQVLAAAADTTPVLLRSLAHCFLPLAAATALGLCASILARRPARAVAIALFAVVAPELLREPLRERAGWLLSSHLPTGLRDDSAVGYLAAVARGAADAFWPWSGLAVLAPLLWFAAAVLLARICFRRLPVP